MIFTLKSGSADFPYIISDYHLPIYPAKDGGGIEWEKGVSAGPFILERLRAGREMHRPSATPTTSRRTALFRRRRDAVDHRCHGAHQRAQHRRNSLHGSRRPQDHRSPEAEPQYRDHQCHRLRPLCCGDGCDGAALRQCRCAGLASNGRSTARRSSTRSCFGYGSPGNDNPIAPAIKYATNPEPVYQV